MAKGGMFSPAEMEAAAKRAYVATVFSRLAHRTKPGWSLTIGDVTYKNVAKDPVLLTYAIHAEHNGVEHMFGQFAEPGYKFGNGLVNATPELWSEAVKAYPKLCDHFRLNQH